MRRFLAILLTVITIFALKETYYIFSSNEPEILSKKAQLSVVAITITLPLILLTLWLWSGKRKEQQ